MLFEGETLEVKYVEKLIQIWCNYKQFQSDHLLEHAHALRHCKLTLFCFSDFLLAVAQKLTHWESDAIQTLVHLKKTQLQL
jgi:hypothetical protein